MRIRVLVADDFPLFREGVTAVLHADAAFDVVAHASDGIEAAERAAALRPDVVLLDMMMPRCGGTEAIQLVRARAPGARVLAMSASERVELLEEALAAGAGGYVTKLSRPQELRDALVDVHGGRISVSPLLAERVLRSGDELDDRGRDAAVRPRGLLSGREQDVLRFVARGCADATIAEELGIRLRTVQNHLARIREKTQLRRRSELVAWAMRHGVL